MTEYWWADRDLMYAAMSAVVIQPETGEEIDPSALTELISLWLAEIPTGTVDIAGVPPSAISTADFSPVSGAPIVGLVKDQVTGVVVDVTPDGSGIPPLLPYAAGGSIVNPAWITHKAAVAVGAVPAQSNVIPSPDTVTIFTGTGRGPTWEEVWGWTTAEQRSHMTFLIDGAPVSGAEVNAVTDIVAASVTKALGGFISGTLEAALSVDLAMSSRIDGLQLTTYGAVANLEHEIADLRDTNLFLTEFVIPDLQAQITQLRTSIPLQIEEAIQANNVRIRDAWIAPLQTGLQTETQQRIQGDQSVLSKIEPIASTVAKAAVAPALVGLAGLATRVGTLEGEAERCGRPICNVLGPGTPLNNLLNALKKLLEAGLLAALLTANASDVERLVATIGAKLAAIISDFEQFFAPGGETVAGLITRTASELA